jgi:hypothetical protein
METSSSLQLKQSGMKDDPQPNKPSLARYPSQFDESSVRTDITEADIATYLRRAAAKASEKEYELSCYSSFQCDQDLTAQDCPQNECYKNYLDPNHLDAQKLEPSKKVFFDNLKDVISTPKLSNAYQNETESYVQIKNRVDDLLQKRAPNCDEPKMVETPQLPNSDNICSRSRPNECDTVIPNNMDCNGRECYKKYLSDDLMVVQKDKSQNKNNNAMRVKIGDHESFLPMKANAVSRHEPNQRENFISNESNEFQKKFNTLIVNSDISVPAFVDVLVVISEKPIKISLPSLNGPALASTIGKVVSSSNLLIKNLSLTTHQVVATGNNKIDTVRSSIAIEPAGKKTLGAINDTWILL